MSETAPPINPHVGTTHGQRRRRRAVGIIHTEVAGYRWDRYLLNMQGLARRHELEMCELVVVDHESRWPTMRLLRAVRRRGAAAIIAPSIAHIARPCVLTDIGLDLYVVGRSRIYRRGHRWARRLTHRQRGC